MKKTIIALFIFLLPPFIGVPLSAADPGQVRIEWDAVTGARGYIVEIQNPQRKPLVKKNTPANFILLKIEPGSYRIKVTALNIFMKPDTNTGWAALTVRKKEPEKDEATGKSEAVIGRPEKEKQPEREEPAAKKEEHTEKQQEQPAKKEEPAIKKEEQPRKKEEPAHGEAADYSHGLLGLGSLDIAAGGSWQVPLAPWSRYLKIAPSGHVNLAYGFAGIPGARGIPFISSLGLSVKFGGTYFTGVTRYGSPLTLLNLSPGAGLFYNVAMGTAGKWAFDFRVSCVVGPSFSLLTTGELPKRKNRAVSLSYDAQALFKFSYGGYFFIDAGFGYQSVRYTSQPLHALYPFVQVGVRL